MIRIAMRHLKIHINHNQEELAQNTEVIGKKFSALARGKKKIKAVEFGLQGPFETHPPLLVFWAGP